MEERTSPVTHLILHHTAGDERSTEEVRAKHLAKGFEEIGYQGVIERDGTVGIGRPLSWAGAQDLGADPVSGVSYNQCGYGLACIGDFNLSEMPEAQYASLLNESAHICSDNNISLNKVIRHTPDGCPGVNFPYKRLVYDLEVLLTNRVRDEPVTDTRDVHCSIADKGRTWFMENVINPVTAVTTVTTVTAEPVEAPKSALVIEVENIIRPMLADAVVVIMQQIRDMTTRIDLNQTNINMLRSTLTSSVATVDVSALKEAVMAMANSLFPDQTQVGDDQ